MNRREVESAFEGLLAGSIPCWRICAAGLVGPSNLEVDENVG